MLRACYVSYRRGAWQLPDKSQGGLRVSFMTAATELTNGGSWLGSATS